MAKLSRNLPKTLLAATALLLLCCGSVTVSRADEVLASLGQSDAIFIDGRTFQVVPGSAKNGITDSINALNARYLGPAAIVFRSGDKVYVASLPLPLEHGAAGDAGDAYVTAEEEPPGPIHIQYVPPNDPSQQKVYDMIRRRQSLETVQKIFSPFQLPVDVVIKTIECGGVSNAWYQREDNRPTVSVCYEYLQEIWQSMPEKDSSSEGLTMADAVCGQLFFAIAHELGHAMFDIFDVPVFGRQEDAADQFATFIMLQFGGDQARRMVSGAAYGYHGYVKDLKAMPNVTLPLAAFSSDHGSPEERYFNLICTAYGYDPKLFASEMDKIPESRAKKCKFEYDDLKFAFHETFKSHLDYDMVKKVLATKWLIDPGH
jgi:Putative metallopeptidase